MARTKLSASTALALAAVLLSSSTAVFAVASLPKHSVGKKQLKAGAVTNSKIHTGAVSGSKIAPNTVVSASRMAFGKGNATDVPAKTLLSLPRVGITVKTDGDADQSSEVVVHLPAVSTFDWFVNSSEEAMFSTMGGDLAFTPAGASREVTVHIWRNSSSAGIYLHCAFDTDGFSSSHPISCWALST